MLAPFADQHSNRMIRQVRRAHFTKNYFNATSVLCLPSNGVVSWIVLEGFPSGALLELERLVSV